MKTTSAPSESAKETTALPPTGPDAAPENGVRQADARVSVKLSVRLEVMVDGIRVPIEPGTELTQVTWNEVVTAARTLVEKAEPTVRRVLKGG